MNPLAILGLVTTYGPILQWAWQTATSNQSFLTKVEQELPVLAKYAPAIVQQIYPQGASSAQQLATAAVALNAQLVRYAQQACNLILSPSPALQVDGMYGPKTKAAVEQLQKTLGLTADGIIGKLTEAAIKKALPNLAM